MLNHENSRVLIVDDDLEFQRSLSKILQKAGYEVCVAADGLQASNMLSHEYYPLILLDVHMPGKSGLELLKEVKQKSPESNVIIVTVNGATESLWEVEKAGAFAFLSKPVKREQILHYVEQALQVPHY
ncbi:MAG: response regulator [bacterium]